jgi:hypothetical protein
MPILTPCADAGTAINKPHAATAAGNSLKLIVNYLPGFNCAHDIL